MTTSSRLGSMVEQARTAKRLSKVALAANAGISRNTVQQLESGMGNVELKTLLAVCEVLELDIVLAPAQIAAKMQPALGTGSHLARRSSGDQEIRPPQATNGSFLASLIREKERAISDPPSKSARNPAKTKKAK